MDTLSLVIIAVLIILLFSWLTQKEKTNNSLPGPTGLPILGYLPFLTKKPFVKFKKLAEKYGPVYIVRLGCRDVVILCDFKSIKEAFADDAFMGRPQDLPYELSKTTIRTGAVLDLPWKEQKRFSLHALRDLGFGKSRMEEHIKDEILELLERLEKNKDSPVKMSDYLAPSASNNIASLLFGKRMKYDDPRRARLDKLNSDVGLRAGAVGWQMFFPYIRSFMDFFNLGNNGKLVRALYEVKGFIREELEEHEKTLDPNNIRDFIDAYLLEIRKKSNDPNTGFQKEVLLDLARGLFGAGSETVRVTVDWALLMAADFPEFQARIHQEIDDVLGRDRFPTWQDHLQMPYTEAAILEIMRWKTIVPLNVMRYTLKDTELNGYFIPNKSYVLAIFYALDHDESLWGKDVHVFRPERFLSEDGKKVVKPEYFIPFSIGKRSCPGKTLAEIEIFLYFTAILQKFKLSMPAGKRADFEGILGISLQPERQDICLELR